MDTGKGLPSSIQQKFRQHQKPLDVSGKNDRDKFRITVMKTNLNLKKLIPSLFTAVFALAASAELIAQEKESTGLKDFKVVMEKTENGIKMQSVEGSAWIDLSFSLAENGKQAIDQYGMTKLN